MHPVGARFRADEARRGTAVGTAAMSTAGAMQVAAGILETMLTSSVLILAMYLTSGILFFAVGWYGWVLVARGYTEASGAGLVVRRAGPAVLVPWREITELRPVRRGRYVRVRVRRTRGRPLLLVAPLTRASRPSPRFAAELRSLHSWWYSAAGPWPVTAGPTPSNE
jgi:hypothetical protein